MVMLRQGADWTLIANILLGEPLCLLPELIVRVGFLGYLGWSPRLGDSRECDGLVQAAGEDHAAVFQGVQSRRGGVGLVHL